MFNANDYRKLSDIVFAEDYPGYRPNIIEAPQGNDVWDTEKRFSHVAMKYLNNFCDSTKCSILTDYLLQATEKSIDIAIDLGVPKRFWPDYRYSNMRILEYPPGAVTAPHEDFDLFTTMLFRNTEDNFKYLEKPLEHSTTIGHKQFSNFGEYTTLHSRKIKKLHGRDYQHLNHKIHFGEILNLVNSNYEADKHEVVADLFNRTQYSIVFFAIPDWEAVLPSGITVGKWLEERISRSRKEVK